MTHPVLRSSTLCLCCLALCMAACSKNPTSPTGFAVGIGGSSEAVFASEELATNPIQAWPGKSTTVPDIHGTFSVESFQGTHPDLSHAHQSAEGFRDFLATWYPPNFTYRDEQVGTWAYHDLEGSDNWDLWSFEGVDRGIDAVMVVFNSSYGSLSDDGVFSFALGESWQGRGWNARTDSMSIGGNDGDFGDERNRYIFWDAGRSVTWSGDRNPYDTWARSANGVRMIFGYDDDPLDSPISGQFFWEEWSKGKPLTNAFLDASWRVDTDQSPCVVAFGATIAEAQTIKETEYQMSWTPVESAAAAWRWYYTAKTVNPEKQAALSDVDVPGEVATRLIRKRGNSSNEVMDIARSVGIHIADERMIQDRPFGLRRVVTESSTLTVDSDGDYELRINRPTGKTGGAPAGDDESLVARARQIVEQFGLAGNSDYRFNDMRYLAENQADVSSAPGEARIVERTVVFDQVIGDLAFIDPDAGRLELTFSADDDQLVGIRSTVREVIPTYEKATEETPGRSLDELRSIALHSLTRSPVPGPTGSPKSVERLEIDETSERIGYRIIDGHAVPMYRAILSHPNQATGKRREAVVPLAGVVQ